METAVHISDTLFEKAERTAQRLGITRSDLYETALTVFLETETPTAAARLRDRFDAVYRSVDGSLDPVLETMQTQSLAAEDW